MSGAVMHPNEVAEQADAIARADEQRARQRHRTLAKARKARKEQADTLAWQDVKAHIKLVGCKCDLRPGMGWSELVALGPGCTGLKSEGGNGGGYVCPALDIYRSKVKR